MSSSMLEQAVIDAEELKKAAVKNAEHTILEKYSNEIKEARQMPHHNYRQRPIYFHWIQEVMYRLGPTM